VAFFFIYVRISYVNSVFTYDLGMYRFRQGTCSWWSYSYAMR